MFIQTGCGMVGGLFIADSLDGVEVGGAACRVPAKEEAHSGAYREGDEYGANIQREGQLLDEGGGEGIDA